MTVTATFCSAVTVFADDTASSNKYLHGFEGYYFLPDIPNADPASSWMGDELTIYEITADYVSFDYQHPMRGHSIVYTAEKAYFTDAYTAVANGTVAFADTPYDTVSLQFTLSFSNNSIRLHIIPQNATGRDRTITFTSSGIVYPEEFTDVPENHWAHDYIMSLTNNGIIMGYEDGKLQT